MVISSTAFHVSVPCLPRHNASALVDDAVRLPRRTTLAGRLPSSCGWPLHHGQPYRPLGVFAISSNEFRPGTSIEFDGAPWRVQEFLHVKPGKGAAFVRTKLRNYITGNTIEKTFRAGETVADAVVLKDLKQFTYKDAEQYVFMDMVTYEEARLNEVDIGDKNKWLKEGMECNVLSWNERVIDVELPMIVKLQVAQTDPGVKGDTAQGGSKPATLDTGAIVNVPLFVTTGDSIIVDTRTGTYMSRA